MHTNQLVFYLFALAAVVARPAWPMSKNIFWRRHGVCSRRWSEWVACTCCSRPTFSRSRSCWVYIGGVLVLIIFAVMLTSQIKEIEVIQSKRRGSGVFFFGADFGTRLPCCPLSPFGHLGRSCCGRKATRLPPPLAMVCSGRWLLAFRK